MIIQRPQLILLKERLKEKRRYIQVLAGPRQVGKTTMVSQLSKQIKTPLLSVSTDGVSNTGTAWISQQWENARFQLAHSKAKEFLLIIDEIQKIDNWSETVKQLWDDDTRKKRNIKVILLGSSRLLMQTGMTESLAGRYETTYMSHWSFSEMRDAFGWNESQYAWFGGYPGSVGLVRDEHRWKQYVAQSLIESSISKDVLMLTRVDKPALMKRLFELGCTYSGQILSFTKILGQMTDAGNTTTLSHYLKLLDTAGLLGGLEKFTAGKLRQRSSSPKFQVHNTALISAQRSELYKEIVKQPSEWGRIVESAVGAHLMNYSITEEFELFYWRDGNDEIDFVLRKEKKVVGLEIKSGASQKPQGAISFKKNFPGAKLLLIGNSGIPWQKFLKVNPVELF